jgi:ABC-type phosphate transport system substrate-binding protein
MTPRRPLRPIAAIAALMVALTTLLASTTSESRAESYVRISGEGSSWSANAIDAMRVNVRQFGITVDYNPSGSTAGRKNFLNGTVDFAASDIPFQFEPEDGSAPETPAPGSYAYMPITAGGTAFMYNLIINGKRVTNLRLSGENVTKLFTGVITQWNDPALQADNPGIVLPARKVVPVVRSDGSGATGQLTLWMISKYPDLWNAYCQKSERAPACGETSFYPTITGMISQAGDLGVAGYVSQGFAEGAIGYVNYSYALGTQFPTVKLLNSAGFYTEPTPQNVAVSLLKSKINTDESNPAKYLTQDLSGVYNDTDPRSYQLSSYSYLILPTKLAGQFTEDKGKTLGAFSYYALCQAQQQSASLGYSPMPVNLVEAGFEQIAKVPGVITQDIDITKCNNPTFSPDGTNLLAKNAPQPQACDKQGVTMCPNGTAGLSNVPTAVAGGTTGGGGATPTTVASGAPGGGGATPTTLAGSAPPAGGTTPGAPTPATLPGGAPATTVAGVAVDPNTDPGTPTGCDPDTGLCDAVAVVDPSTGQPSDVASAAPVGPVLPTTLDSSNASGTTLALVVLVIILMLALVVVPALSWRYFSERGAS